LLRPPGTPPPGTARRQRQPDAAKATERFRGVNLGQMDIDVTIDDPKDLGPARGRGRSG
jgi:hypothetical protein